MICVIFLLQIQVISAECSSSQPFFHCVQLLPYIFPPVPRLSNGMLVDIVRRNIALYYPKKTVNVNVINFK